MLDVCQAGTVRRSVHDEGQSEWSPCELRQRAVHRARGADPGQFWPALYIQSPEPRRPEPLTLPLVVNAGRAQCFDQFAARKRRCATPRTFPNQWPCKDVPRVPARCLGRSKFEGSPRKKAGCHRVSNLLVVCRIAVLRLFLATGLWRERCGAWRKGPRLNTLTEVRLSEATS